jgi:hypothetical protein
MYRCRAETQPASLHPRAEQNSIAIRIAEIKLTIDPEKGYTI